MHRRVALAIVALAFCVSSADAMVLSCFPADPKGKSKIDAYIDGFVEGEYPPKKIETVRVLARFGEDIFEFFPEQTKKAFVQNGELQIQLWQPLSAGASAEIGLQGKLAPTKGEQFFMQLDLRTEQRTGQARVRCTID